MNVTFVIDFCLCDSFTVLVDRLCHSMVLAAPDYVAVSGPDSACVCARDQSKSVFVRSLNDSATHLNVLVQTNYDSCKGEPGMESLRERF